MLIPVTNRGGEKYILAKGEIRDENGRLYDLAVGTEVVHTDLTSAYCLSTAMIVMVLLATIWAYRQNHHFA